MLEISRLIGGERISEAHNSNLEVRREPAQNGPLGDGFLRFGSSFGWHIGDPIGRQLATQWTRVLVPPRPALSKLSPLQAKQVQPIPEDKKLKVVSRLGFYNQP